MNKSDLKEIINNCGNYLQTIVAIEEMSELTKELSKALRGKTNRDALVEELADTLLMLEQIKIIYEISNNEINDIVEQKITRTLNKIKESL